MSTRPARSGGRRVGAAAILAVPVVLATVILSDVGGIFLLLSYGIPGLFLAVRRPGQPIAWLLLLMALGLAIGTSRVTATLDELMAGTADPMGNFTAWANGIGWVFVFEGLLGIALVFPSGSMPAGRWRPVAWLLVATSIPLTLALLFGPLINVTVPGEAFAVDVPNPFALRLPGGASALAAITTPLWIALGILVIVGGLSLVARFRVSSGLERLQYRWLAWALAIVGIGSVAWALVTTVLRVDLPLLAAVIVALSYPAIPIAIVVAVLRFRLYEIDRLVSRGLGWGIATATVVTVFALGVLGLQAALTGVTQGQTLAVAASTLLALVAFAPVRSRVQALVDRHFDRPRLEAQRVITAHGERMRQEVDLAALVDDVEGTTLAVLRPSTAALWIRGSWGTGHPTPAGAAGPAIDGTMAP